MNTLGRDGFGQIKLSDFQELLESQDEYLTKIEFEEKLDSHSIEEEVTTNTETNIKFKLFFTNGQSDFYI